ncbi:MAG: hypothetical protein NZ822_02180 [Patescibacteria group bacterium]|nr:hypothetical protein [Patescibacteria group bacterium]
MLTRCYENDIPEKLARHISSDEVNISPFAGGVQVKAKPDTETAYWPSTCPWELFQSVEGEMRIAVEIYCTPDQFIGARINGDEVEIYLQLEEGLFCLFQAKVSLLKRIAAELPSTIRAEDYR